MKIVVFLGPSLSLTEARNQLDAIYLPPAQQSDLLSAVQTHQPDVIALIDGVFDSRPSVWHKEILYALKKGVAVYGASSMGALRIAETAAFGAIGVGRIFHMYAHEGLLDDDEVALSHADAEFQFRPTSEPMVNVRATLNEAARQGVVDERLNKKLQALAKSQHYTGRNFSTILEAAGLEEELRLLLRDWVKANYVDLKKQDALELLTHLAQLEKAPKPELEFELQETAYLSRQLRLDKLVPRQAASIPRERVANHYSLHAEDSEEISFHALNGVVAAVVAEMVGLQCSEQELGTETTRFRLQRKIKAANLDAWITENGLEPEEFQDLMTQRVLARKVHQWMMREGYRATKGSNAVLNLLRLRGDYGKWADAAANEESIVKQNFPDFPGPDYGKVDMQDLVIDQIRSTDCRMTLPYDEWAKEVGYIDTDALKLDLVRSQLARSAVRDMIKSTFLSPSSS